MPSSSNWVFLCNYFAHFQINIAKQKEVVTKLDYIPFKFAQKLIINLNLFIMENIAIANKIIELRDKVKEQENQLENQRHYLVSNHRGVYYCFKLIRNSHWVSYIGVPEYVEVRTGERDENGLFLYNQIYIVDYCHPEEDYRGIELGHCPQYWIPSEVTFIGCGMNVDINSKVPLHWMGFDYAHLNDMNLEEAQEILKDWDVNFKDDIENRLSDTQKIKLSKETFYTYEDVKNDCIKCIDSILDTTIEQEVSSYEGMLRNEFNLL
jgi:hypothetical protein